MSELSATILTAIATLVLAVGAAFTAVLAGWALKKQSEELRILQKQAKDAADLLEVQSDQLDVQRDQFESLRKINDKQTAVLELQTDDLRESIRERERLRKATERAQADEIGFRMTATGFPGIAEEDGGGDFVVALGPDGSHGHPANARVAASDMHRHVWMSDEDRIWKCVDAVKAGAMRANVRMSVLSLAWVLRQPAISSVLIGAQSAEELMENLGALDLDIDPSIWAELDQATSIPPSYPNDFYDRLRMREGQG
jgi:hypothetical protein